MSKLTESQQAALKPWAWLYLISSAAGGVSFGFLFWYQFHASRQEPYLIAIWCGTTFLIQSIIQSACFYKSREIRGERITFYNCFSLIFRIAFFFVLFCWAIKCSVPG